MSTVRAARIAENGAIAFIDLEPSITDITAELGAGSSDMRYGPGWVAVEPAHRSGYAVNPIAQGLFRRFAAPGVVADKAFGPALILGFSPDKPGSDDFPGVCDLPDEIDAFLVLAQYQGAGRGEPAASSGAAPRLPQIQPEVLERMGISTGMPHRPD